MQHEERNIVNLLEINIPCNTKSLVLKCQYLKRGTYSFALIIYELTSPKII